MKYWSYCDFDSSNNLGLKGKLSLKVLRFYNVEFTDNDSHVTILKTQLIVQTIYKYKSNQMKTW